MRNTILKTGPRRVINREIESSFNELTNDLVHGMQVLFQQA